MRFDFRIGSLQRGGFSKSSDFNGNMYVCVILRWT